MSKLMLVSILIASVLIPLSAVGATSAQQGLRTVVLRSALFMAAYGVMLRFVYPRLQ